MSTPHPPNPANVIERPTDHAESLPWELENRRLRAEGIARIGRGGIGDAEVVVGLDAAPLVLDLLEALADHPQTGVLLEDLAAAHRIADDPDLLTGGWTAHGAADYAANRLDQARAALLTAPGVERPLTVEATLPIELAVELCDRLLTAEVLALIARDRVTEQAAPLLRSVQR